jgi:hypothetical protein
MPEVMARSLEPVVVPTRSSAQPPLHLALLSLATLGSYELYWFWRNWRDLESELGVRSQPLWRTIGLLVPVLNVVLVYEQLRAIRDECTRRGIAVSYSPSLVTATFFAIALAGNLTLLWPLSLFNVVPLLQVQVTLNGLWARLQPGALMRTQFAPYELVALVLGCLVTAGALLATFGSLVPR